MYFSGPNSAESINLNMREISRTGAKDGTPQSVALCDKAGNRSTKIWLMWICGEKYDVAAVFFYKLSVYSINFALKMSKIVQYNRKKWNIALLALVSSRTLGISRIPCFRTYLWKVIFVEMKLIVPWRNDPNIQHGSSMAPPQPLDTIGSCSSRG